MILVEEALSRILALIHRMGKERLPILHALGRVLGEDVHAPHSIPPWDNSAMDGYAVRWADVASASPDNPVRLTVLGDLPAGSVFRGRVGPGEGVRIMTGAPLPAGADTIVQVEETKKDGAEVIIFGGPGAGKNVRRAGEDVQAGDLGLAEGTVLRPAHIGLLASFQRSSVYVYQQPRVAILSTGDELLEVDDPWQDGKIVNSNSYSLAAQVAECGACPVQIGIARDRLEDLGNKIHEALAADALLTSGGVSVGDYDFVKTLLKEMGEMNFWKVAMRPGQPLAFGTVGDKPLFGLPGNPVSVMVSFEQFVRPALLNMAGHRNIFRPALPAVLREEIEKKAGLTHFIRCRLVQENGVLYASTTGEQGSGMLSSMAKADALIVLPRERTRFQAGEEVRVLILNPLFFYTPEPGYL
jgi:molybdopterin molybdotransferase